MASPGAAAPTVTPDITPPFCLCNGYHTTVWDFGTPCAQTVAWHVVAGVPLFPFPAGYRTSTTLYGHGAAAVVRAGAPLPPDVPPLLPPVSGHHPPDVAPTFVILWGAGHEFRGGTPSAPAAKLALFLRTADMAPGLEMWGFSHPVVQAALTLRAERAGCGGGGAAVAHAFSAAAAGGLRGDSCATAAAPGLFPAPGVLPAPLLAPLAASVGAPDAGPAVEGRLAPPLPRMGLGVGAPTKENPVGERTPTTP